MIFLKVLLIIWAIETPICLFIAWKEHKMEKDNIRIISPEELEKETNSTKHLFSDSLFIGYDQSESDESRMLIARYDGDRYALIQTFIGKEAKDLYHKLTEKEQIK